MHTLFFFFCRLRWNTKEKLISRITGWYSTRGCWRVNRLLCLKRCVFSTVWSLTGISALSGRHLALGPGACHLVQNSTNFCSGVNGNAFLVRASGKLSETTVLLETTLFEVPFFSGNHPDPVRQTEKAASLPFTSEPNFRNSWLNGKCLWSLGLGELLLTMDRTLEDRSLPLPPPRPSVFSSPVPLPLNSSVWCNLPSGVIFRGHCKKKKNAWSYVTYGDKLNRPVPRTYIRSTKFTVERLAKIWSLRKLYTLNRQ